MLIAIRKFHRRLPELDRMGAFGGLMPSRILRLRGGCSCRSAIALPVWTGTEGIRNSGSTRASMKACPQCGREVNPDALHCGRSGSERSGCIQAVIRYPSAMQVPLFYNKQHVASNMQQAEERPVIDDAGRYVQIQQQPATDVNSVSTPLTVCRRVAIFGPQLM